MSIKPTIKLCPFCEEALEDSRSRERPWHGTTITDTYACGTQSEREAAGEDTAKFKQSGPCKIIAKLKKT